MSDDHSDPADMTNDGEVELNLPREVVEEQVLPREDIQKPPGAINPGTIAIGQEERHRFEPPNGARSKWPRHGLPLPSILEPRSPVTTANVGGSGADRPGPDFFRSFNERRQSAGVETPTRVGGLRKEPGFPGPRWTTAGRWDTV